MATVKNILNEQEIELVLDKFIKEILEKPIQSLTLYELKELGFIFAKQQIDTHIELNGIMPQVNLASHAVLEITQRCINLNLPIYS